MAIELDSTKHSTVVCCTLCGSVDLADSPREGWAIGAAHEERAHPEIEQARHAARMKRNRDTPHRI